MVMCLCVSAPQNVLQLLLMDFMLSGLASSPVSVHPRFMQNDSQILILETRISEIIMDKEYVLNDRSYNSPRLKSCQ